MPANAQLGLWEAVALAAAGTDDSDGEDESAGSLRAFGLLVSGHVANVFVPMVLFFGEAMRELARNRSMAMLGAGLLCLPYARWISRLVRDARRKLSGDEVAASLVRARWRMVVLLYVGGSWLAFLLSIVVAAARTQAGHEPQ